MTNIDNRVGYEAVMPVGKGEAVLFDHEGGSVVASEEQFIQLYETAQSDDQDAEKLLVSYRALLAAQQGRRADYLRERIKLNEFDWGMACDGEPAFFRLDSGTGVSWRWVLEAHLSIEALALAYEIEEASSEVIYPNTSAEEQWKEMRFRIANELHDGEVLGSGMYESRYIAMICYRIRHVISTGAQDQPLISRLIASRRSIRDAYAAELAAYEATVLTQATARIKERPKKGGRRPSGNRL